MHLVTNSLIKGEYFMQCVRAQGPVAYINARGSHVQGHVQHHLSLQIFTCPPCSDLLAPLCFTRHCKSYPVCSPHLISRYQFCSLIACLSFDRPKKEKEGEQGKNLIRKGKRGMETSKKRHAGSSSSSSSCSSSSTSRSSSSDSLGYLFGPPKEHYYSSSSSSAPSYSTGSTFGSIFPPPSAVSI